MGELETGLLYKKPQVFRMYNFHCNLFKFRSDEVQPKEFSWTSTVREAIILNCKQTDFNLVYVHCRFQLTIKRSRVQYFLCCCALSTCTISVCLLCDNVIAFAMFFESFISFGTILISFLLHYYNSLVHFLQTKFFVVHDRRDNLADKELLLVTVVRSIKWCHAVTKKSHCSTRSLFHYYTRWFQKYSKKSPRDAGFTKDKFVHIFVVPKLSKANE